MLCQPHTSPAHALRRADAGQEAVKRICGNPTRVVDLALAPFADKLVGMGLKECYCPTDEIGGEGLHIGRKLRPRSYLVHQEPIDRRM
eukprot:7037008-Alexandrium_andersonii.AAC.1